MTAPQPTEKAKREAKRERPAIVLPAKPRKPLGVAMPLTEAEIERLAVVTPEAIEAIKGELVPELRELLEAQEEGEP